MATIVRTFQTEIKPVEPVTLREKLAVRLAEFDALADRCVELESAEQWDALEALWPERAMADRRANWAWARIRHAENQIAEINGRLMSGTRYRMPAEELARDIRTRDKLLAKLG